MGFGRNFSAYGTTLRPVAAIDAGLKRVTDRILTMIRGLAA